MIMCNYWRAEVERGPGKWDGLNWAANRVEQWTMEKAEIKLTNEMISLTFSPLFYDGNGKYQQMFPFHPRY